jgi:ABC-type antimicrobial peptide transport system permease subunit
VGKCLIIDEPGTACREVVGVVSNANSRGYIEDPPAQFYVPAQQAGRDQPSTIVVRVAPGGAAAVLPAVQSAMVEGFPGWGPPRVRTLASILAPQLQPRRLAASVYGAAAFLALLIAAVGIYSSVAYAVGQRMHEMGVRTALGARSSHLVGLILGEGVRVVFVGVALGVGLALALGKAIASLLYNTSTRDPVLLTSVSLALITVAVIACFVPAWRATRANPVEVLRAD